MSHDESRKSSGIAHWLGAGVIGLLATIGRHADDAFRMGARHADDIGSSTLRSVDDIAPRWAGGTDELMRASDDLLTIRTDGDMAESAWESSVSRTIGTDPQSASLVRHAMEEAIQAGTEIATTSDTEDD